MRKRSLLAAIAASALGLTVACGSPSEGSATKPGPVPVAQPQTVVGVNGVAVAQPSGPVKTLMPVGPRSAGGAELAPIEGAPPANNPPAASPSSPEDPPIGKRPPSV